MNQLEAMRETLAMAKSRDYGMLAFDFVGVEYNHLKSMLERAESEPFNFTPDKLGRWLGFMQGVLVALEVVTLEEMKELNRRYSW